ncbi:MAG TPA: YdeI/OmpD-associated family protein [Reyranella sp.]|nr:YdeI/OmpD-associated family protein [Reyranella sp.]
MAVREFKTAESFYKWLVKNHDKAGEVWIKIHKVGSGLKSITPKEATDVALCWGWIDGLRKGFDDKSFLQRYSPRTKKSVWNQINVDNVARLIREGRMTEHGFKQVEAAKADGRWDRAYRSKGAAVPTDLQAAIDAEPKARRLFDKLSAQNRFALIFRTQNMKTESGRQKKIESLVAMLKRGETIYPQSKRPVSSRA